MKTYRFLQILVATALITACGGSPATPEPPVKDPVPSDEAGEIWSDPTGVKGGKYISNGKVQVGVDPARGGTVFHVSEAGKKKNLVNHYDEGREIQQSYYGWADGSSWNGQSWVWNPVQGGSASGVKGKILKDESTEDKIVITSIPVLWASGEMASDCEMKEVITLEGDVVHIKFSFKYSGAKKGDSRHQELPAFFVDWDLKNFVWYKGSSPWTNDKLSSYVPDRLDQTGKNEYQALPERWAAYVDDSGWGIGLYSPSCSQCTLYRFGSGPGGPKSSPCSYFAPIATMAVAANWTYSYDVYITIGSKEQIRQRFYDIHARK
ncbi:MAG: hypothetical protein MJZ09_07425 [Bacteroidales bacterium]|nr:hypothetical protein [Bacteroidales bacterium]